MPYIGKSPHFGVRNRFIYTASGSETSKSGADDNGAILTFTDGAYVDVYLNGVLLKPDTDYVTTTANTIGSLTALAASDILEVIVYDVFSVSDTVSAASGGAFSGSVRLDGGASFNGLTTLETIGGIESKVQIEGTDYAGGSLSIWRNENDDAGGYLQLGKSRGTAVNSDTIVQADDDVGIINFIGADGGDRAHPIASIRAAVDGSPASNDMPGRIEFMTTGDGGTTLSEKMRITHGGSVGVNIQADADMHNLQVLGASNDEGIVVRGSNGGCIQVVNSTNSDDDFLGQFGFANLANADVDATDADGQTVAWVRARTITSDSNAGDDSGAYLQFVACGEAASVAEVGRLDPSIARFIGATTSTSNSANCQVDGAGRLHTVGSSKIYKTAIEDLEDNYADKIFSLEPKFYKSNPETVGDDTTKLKPDWSYYGLLAEDVAKVEPRLVTFKLTEMNKKDDGSVTYETKELDTPVPMGVNYDRITMHLINIVKRFKTQIETLEAKVKALEDA